MPRPPLHNGNQPLSVPRQPTCVFGLSRPAEALRHTVDKHVAHQIYSRDLLKRMAHPPDPIFAVRLLHPNPRLEKPPATMNPSWPCSSETFTSASANSPAAVSPFPRSKCCANAYIIAIARVPKWRFHVPGPQLLSPARCKACQRFANVRAEPDGGARVNGNTPETAVIIENSNGPEPPGCAGGVGLTVEATSAKTVQLHSHHDCQFNGTRVNGAERPPAIVNATAMIGIGLGPAFHWPNLMLGALLGTAVDIMLR